MKNEQQYIKNLKKYASDIEYLSQTLTKLSPYDFDIFVNDIRKNQILLLREKVNKILEGEPEGLLDYVNQFMNDKSDLDAWGKLDKKWQERLISIIAPFLRLFDSIKLKNLFDDYRSGICHLKELKGHINSQKYKQIVDVIDKIDSLLKS